MSPEDPAHISAMIAALRRALPPDALVTLCARTPTSGGVAIRVTTSLAPSIWLHATRTPPRGRNVPAGGVRYRVRGADGRDLGTGHPQPGASDLETAAEHLAAVAVDPFTALLVRRSRRGQALADAHCAREHEIAARVRARWGNL